MKRAVLGGVPLVLAFVLSACGATNENAPDIADGQRLYQQNCQACHGGQDGAGRIPDAPLHNGDGHTWHHPDQNLTTIILEGSEVAYGRPGMPSWKGVLTEDQIQDILAYIKTWWTEEQREFQRRGTEAVRQQQG